MKRAWILLAGLALAIASMPETGWTQEQEKALKVSSVTLLWPDSLVGTSTNVKSILVHHGDILTGTFGRNILVTSDTGKTWVERGADLDLWLDVVGQITEADSGILFAGANEYILRSTDHGVTWNKARDIRNDVLAVDPILRTKDGTLLAGGAGVLKSTDNGWTWTKIVDRQLAYPWVGDMVQMPSGVVLVGLNGESVPGSGKGILRSTDGGLTFALADSGLPAHKDIDKLAAYPSGSSQTVFAAIYDNGTWRSDDDGLSWSQVNGLSYKYGTSVFVSPDLGIFAGFDRALCYSTGGAWTEITELHGHFILSFAQLSSDELLVGTEDGMYLIKFETLATGVEDRSSVPEVSELSQNYPNPFNPSTTIRFSIPSRVFVEIKIYDVLGREVATLSSKERPQGTYEAVFDASRLPSGTYFYRLQAGSFVQTRKMMLVK